MAGLAPILGSGGAAAFERPTDQGVSPIQGVASVLGNFLGAVSTFQSNQPTPSTPQPTEDERFAAIWQPFLEDQGTLVDPSNQNYRGNLANAAATFLRFHPEFTSQVAGYLNVSGVENTLPLAQRVDQGVEDSFVTWLTETPEGATATILAAQTATDANGTRDEALYAAALDQAYANNLQMTAELSRLNREAEFATDRTAVSNGYWSAYQLTAESTVSGITTEIFDMVEQMRVDPSGSVVIPDEMARIFGMSTGTITAENFAPILTQFRNKLRTDIINSLVSRSDVDSANILAPSEDWVNQVLAPIDQMIAVASTDFGSLAQVQTSIESSITTGAIREANRRNPELMQSFAITNLMPEEVRMSIASTLLSREGMSEDIANLIFVTNAADQTPAMVEDRASRASTDDAEAAAVVSAHALANPALSDVELPNHFISLFANQSRVTPDWIMQEETFRDAVIRNSSRLVAAAEADPEFAATAQRYLGEDLARTLTHVQSQATSYTSAYIVMREDGTLIAAASPVTQQERDYFRANPNGIDPDGRRALDVEALNAQLALYNNKVVALDGMSDLGAQVVDAITLQNSNLIPEPWTSGVSGVEPVITGGMGSAESRGDDGRDTLQTYNIPQFLQEDTSFLTEVNSLSSDLGASPDWLLAAMHFETGGTFDPTIKNPGSTATGLIQFLESTAESLGTSTADLSTMSRTEQMAYVRSYLEPFKGRLNNFGDVYMAIHYPVAVGKEDSYAIYTQGSAAYSANQGLDTDNDGVVTRGEAVARAAERAGIPVNGPAGGPIPTSAPNAGIASRAYQQGLAPISPPSRPVLTTEASPLPRPPSRASAGSTLAPRSTLRPESRQGGSTRASASQVATRNLSAKAMETLLKNGFTKEDLNALGIN